MLTSQETLIKWQFMWQGNANRKKKKEKKGVGRLRGTCRSGEARGRLKTSPWIGCLKKSIGLNKNSATHYKDETSTATQRRKSAAITPSFCGVYLSFIATFTLSSVSLLSEQRGAVRIPVLNMRVARNEFQTVVSQNYQLHSLSPRSHTPNCCNFVCSF